MLKGLLLGKEFEGLCPLGACTFGFRSPLLHQVILGKLPKREQSFKSISLGGFCLRVVKLSFDESALPKVKSLVRSWVQLKVLSEAKDSISIEGRHIIIDLMVHSVEYYARALKRSVLVEEVVL
jgi:hypothetical protein